MKKIFVLIFSVFIFHTNSYGQNLLVNSDFENRSSAPYGLWFSPLPTATSYNAEMSVSSENAHSGSNALVVDVLKTDATVTNYYENIWRVQCTQDGFSTTQGQKILLSFWARADAPHIIQFGITKNSDPYNDYSMEATNLTVEWKKYEMIFISPVTGTDIRIMFKCGNSVGQYYFDDISLTSEGMSDLNWYAKADQRIEQIRKGDFSLMVKDANGNPLKNCDVAVTLKHHDFKWGTALALQPTITSDEAWYRNTAAMYFNDAVFENDFKWPSMEYTNGNVNYSNVDRHLEWGKDNQIQFRGHTLVWGGKQSSPPNSFWMTPSWLWNVSVDSAYSLIERRIKRDIGHYKGKIFEYDLINEPIHEWALTTWLGDSLYVKAFKWAKEADADAKLYINDYDNIDGTTTSMYKSYISYLLSKDAPVEGIGVQCHFHSLIDWQSVKLRMDYLGDLGLPLKITEFDMNINSIGMTEEQQASEYAKMMRIAFSHPNMEGFLFWGFWDSRHWMPKAGIFRADKSAKPAADSVYKLIHDTWSTKVNLKTDENGQISFRGFYGSYDVRAVGCLPGKFAETTFTKEVLASTVELSSTITGVLSSVDTKQITLFPNPATNSTSLVMTSNDNVQTEYVLINALGQVVKTKRIAIVSGHNHVDIDLFDLKPGLYTLQMNVSGSIYVSKLIKSE